jgi:type IV pilus assembly protein PilF
MKRLFVALLLLTGCAGDPGPTRETGQIVGEVGDPRNRARLHTELAALYFGRGNMAVALEELRTAVRADSSYAPAYSMFGLVYMDLKENALAQDNFERALRLSPNEPDINHNFGWFLCQSGRESDSIGYFLQAIRNPLYPTPWRSYSAAGLCSLRMDKVQDAEEFFVRALRQEPDDPSALLNLGQIRYTQGKMEEARRFVSRFNRLVTPTPESLWLALRVERKLGQRVAERNFATELRRRYPGSKETQALQRGDFD